MVIGTACASIGGACFKNNVVGVDDCDDKAGLMLLVNGASDLFVGCLFTLMMYYRKPLAVLAAVAFSFGLVLSSVGGACMRNGLAGVEQCPRRDGLITVLVGCSMMLLSGLPSACVLLHTHFTRTVRTLEFVSGAACFTLGVVLLSLGCACFGNGLLGVDECPRVGLWSTALKLVIVGVSCFLAGCITICVAWLRKNTTKENFIFVLDLIIVGLVVVGLVLFSVGAACLNGTLLRVDDCRRTGTIITIPGGSFAVLGFALFGRNFMLHGGAMFALSTFSPRLRMIARSCTPFKSLVFLVAGIIGLIFLAAGGICLESRAQGGSCSDYMGAALLTFGGWFVVFATTAWCFVLLSAGLPEDEDGGRPDFSELVPFDSPLWRCIPSPPIPRPPLPGSCPGTWLECVTPGVSLTLGAQCARRAVDTALSCSFLSATRASFVCAVAVAVAVAGCSSPRPRSTSRGATPCTRRPTCGASTWASYARRSSCTAS